MDSFKPLERWDQLEPGDVLVTTACREIWLHKAVEGARVFTLEYDTPNTMALDALHINAMYIVPGVYVIGMPDGLPYHRAMFIRQCLRGDFAPYGVPGLDWHSHLWHMEHNKGGLG